MTLVFKFLLFLYIIVYPISIGSVEYVSDTSFNSGDPIIIEEIFTIGDSEKELLYQIGGISIDSSGFLYILDIGDYSLRKYGSQGNLIKKVGRRGQGPGEFLSPAHVKSHNNIVVVSELQQPILHFFTNDLNYINSVQFVDFILDIEYDRNGSLFVAAFTKRLIYEYRHNEKKAAVKLHRSFSTNPMFNAFRFTIDDAGNIIVGYAFFNKIDVYSPEGVLLSSFSIPGFPEKAEMSESGLPETVLIKDITTDIVGAIVVLGGDYSQNKSRDVYRFNHGGKPMGTFTLSDRSRFIRFDAAGNLYTTAADGVVVKKYAVQYFDH